MVADTRVNALWEETKLTYGDHGRIFSRHTLDKQRTSIKVSNVAGEDVIVLTLTTPFSSHR